MPVSAVAPNSVATSAWANSVSTSVNGLEDKVLVSGQLAIPWAAITGKPATFAPTAHAASHAEGGADAMSAAALGAPRARNAPDAAAGGKKIYVGPATPTGMAEGDVWIKG
jgi:hypothetical protein